MRIIPAMDIIGGKCVRLSQGDYSKSLTYSSEPLDVAKQIEDHGLRYLHIVDLDGARSRHIVNEKILQNIAQKTSLEVDFGGGIKSDEDINKAFSCGAAKVTIGSVAITDEELFMMWLEKYGPEKIILGADFKNGMIAYNGWVTESKTEVFSFISKFENKGLHYSICTDISRDGMLSGPSFESYQKLASETTINIIASGGISTMDDIRRLSETGCEGAIIGKALYEKRITLKELESLC